MEASLWENVIRGLFGFEMVSGKLFYIQNISLSPVLVDRKPFEN